MAEDDIVVRVLNEEEVVRGFSALQRAMAGDRVPKVIGMEGLKAIKVSYRAEENPTTGLPWKPSQRGLRGGKTMRDTSILYNSLTYEAEPNVVRIGTNDKRSLVLHYGAHITPKKGRYLLLPVPGAKMQLKASKFDDAFVLSLGGKDYGYDRLWLVRKVPWKKADRGKLDKVNSFHIKGRGKIQFLGLLVRSVDIPGRPIIGMSAVTQDKIIQRLQTIAAKVWGNADTDSGLSN